MRLLDLARHGMVVALGAIDPRAINNWRDGFGDLLVLIVPLKKEPGRAVGARLVCSGHDEITDHFIPRTTLAERILQKGIPAVIPALAFSTSALAAHQQNVP